MSNQLVINGVPDSIRLDGWWLACSDADAQEDMGQLEGSASRTSAIRRPYALPILLTLVLLADWLFWGHMPGISVALFALALTAGVLLMRPRGTSLREWGIALGFEIACNLPVMEQLQPLSLLFTLIGMVVLVVWAGYGRIVEWWQALWAMIRVSTVGAVLLPVRLVDDARGMQAKPDLKHHLKALILPLGIGMVFLFLLTSANPILERFLDQLAGLEFLTVDQVYRVVFWLVVASLVWPYLNLSEAWLGPVAKAPRIKPARMPGLASLVSAESVRNSLILFNLLFLVQTTMDIGVLTGEVSLPEGMTYAGYAHRGAYPLVATALLAGVFAIATYRMIGDSGFLRNLLFLWLGQNLFLVITAAYRLSLYVEAYALTYLRVATFIWMGLVFIGLILTIVQITRAYSIAWLVKSNLAVLMGTLYLCSFINFAWMIADYNLHNSDARVRLDAWYVCGLGEQALPVILDYDTDTGKTMCSKYGREIPVHTPIDNWRDWGFRDWRLQVYLAGELQR